jgi:hypothetical protein
LGTNYKSSINPDTGDAEIRLGDLYSAETKDIVIDIQLQSSPEGQTTEPAQIIASLKYCDVVRSVQVFDQMEKLCVSRSDAPGQPNTAVVEHVQRIQSVKALEQAKELAECGKYSEGCAMLRDAMAKITLTGSASGLMKQLHEDMHVCLSGMQDSRSWRSQGVYQTCTITQSHSKQRSSSIRSPHIGDLTATTSAYDTPSKIKMKKKFQSTRTPQSKLTSASDDHGFSLVGQASPAKPLRASPAGCESVSSRSSDGFELVEGAAHA